MEYTKTLESELNSRQKSHFFGLDPTLVLVLTKADPTTKKQNCKQGAIGAKSANSIYQSDLQTSQRPIWWPAVLGRLVSTWRNKSMQNFVIIS